MDRGAFQATVHAVTKSQTRLTVSLSDITGVWGTHRMSYIMEHVDFSFPSVFTPKSNQDTQQNKRPHESRLF